MEQTPLTMPIDMSYVVAAADCPHYLSIEEAEQTTICAWCSVRPIRTFGRPGVSGPNSGTTWRVSPGRRSQTTMRADKREEAA